MRQVELNNRPILIVFNSVLIISSWKIISFVVAVVVVCFLSLSWFSHICKKSSSGSQLFSHSLMCLDDASPSPPSLLLPMAKEISKRALSKVSRA